MKKIGGEKAKKQKSFYKSIAAMMIVLVFALLILFITASRFFIKSIYEEEYNDRVLNINKLIAAQLDGDKLEEYIVTKERDDDYYSMLQNMFNMKNIFDVEYIYVMAEDSTVGNGHYIYIFDVDVSEGKQFFDEGNLGSEVDPSDFPGAEEVLKTGIGFDKARYYEGEEYGRLYYAYTPVLNSEGNAVAVLGTDVDATPMLDTIFKFQVYMIGASILIAIIVLTVIIYYGKRKFSVPVLKLTNDITSLSHGSFDLEKSESLSERKDELGLIYSSFYEVKKIISSIIYETNKISEEVMVGNLSVRMESKNFYQGAYAKVCENSNKMLDNICSLIDMMPNSVIIYNNNFEEIYSNNPERISSNYNESNIHKKQIKNIELLNHNKEKIEKIYNEFSKNNLKSYNEVFSLKDDNGQKLYFDSFFIKMDSVVPKSGTCAVFTDVTEYMEMSEQAQASSRAKSEFLSRMSHEIRTPLNAIMGITEITKHNTDDNNILQNLETIEKSADHLLTIVNDVLDISKIEAGNMQLVYEPFSISRMMQDVIGILEQQAALKEVGLNLIIKGFDEKLFVVGDEVRLRQVVINLISNAIKFSKPGSDIIIKIEKNKLCSKERISIKFSVKDYGIGITEEKKDIIFEAFEQGGGKITRQYGGTGLGLPISAKIVTLMGGEGILVESELDKGSIFSFDLDFKISDFVPEKLVEKVGKDAIDFEKTKILLVDDIEINREIVIGLLDEHKPDIDCADDGAIAVEKFMNSPIGYYQLVLMDIQMKEMDGYTATRKIRESGRKDSKSIKIVAMSANAYEEDKDKAKKAGMDAYLTKPVDYNEMIKTISETLSV